MRKINVGALITLTPVRNTDPVRRGEVVGVWCNEEGNVVVQGCFPAQYGNLLATWTLRGDKYEPGKGAYHES